ncbi:MAG: nucleic acid-binding protein [Gemmatimonadetes bacterium]|nr:nucleic acid-binding protein [Gemmatimonadota bacterium]
MRIYLDVCAIQRPFDDAVQERILRETEALLRVIKLVEQGVVDLVGSFALDIETEANPDAVKRAYMERVLSLAQQRVIPGAAVEQRTDAYRSLGLDTWDAAHLAAAVEARVDLFCTCDDKLLRRARKADTGLTRVVSLLELIEEVER